MSTMVRTLLQAQFGDFDPPVSPAVEAKRYVYPMDWTVTTQTARTYTVTTTPGQLVIPFGMLEDDTQTLTTPTGNSLTFLQAVAASALSKGYAAIWTAVDAAGGTNWALSVARSGAASFPWGFGAIVAPAGWTKGAANGNTGTAAGQPVVSLTTTADNSAALVICTDWQAFDDSGRVWPMINGFRPNIMNMGELAYNYMQTDYTIMAALYPDVGAAGVKSFQFESGVGTGGWSMAALEIKAPAGGGPIAFEGWGVAI